MDQPHELIFLFAALPSLVIAPLSFLEIVSENFTLLACALAFTGWTFLFLFNLRRSRERFTQFSLLAITSGISLFQALLGILMIAGKSC